VQLNFSTNHTQPVCSWLANILLPDKHIPDSEIVVALLWQIWQARNHSIFRSKRSTHEQIVDLAFITAESNRSKPQDILSTGERLLPTSRNWNPPPVGTIKVNVDGAFPMADQKGSVACICRNHEGNLIGGSSQIVPASSPLQTEIRALHHALLYLIEKGINEDHLQVDSDYLAMVDMLNNRCSPPWDCRTLIVDVETLLSRFPLLRLSYCRREANSLADWAAKACGRGFLHSNWASSPPSIVLDLLCIDALAMGSTPVPM